MKYDKDACQFVLSNGRTFQSGANRAIGLSVYEDAYEITVGYDRDLGIDPYDKEPTNAEKIEIAEYVIAQWTEYLATLRRSGSHE